MTQEEINQWEIKYFYRIVKWVKDFENNTVEFILDYEKTGESVIFTIKPE